MIIQEPTEEDKVELFDSATQILEDAAKNKESSAYDRGFY